MEKPSATEAEVIASVQSLGFGRVGWVVARWLKNASR